MSYPGKKLGDSLIQLTSNLGYRHFGSIKIITKGHIINTKGFIVLINAKFRELVVQGMPLSPFGDPFDSTNLISDRNCQKVIIEGEEITISVYYGLFLYLKYIAPMWRKP